MPASRAAVPLAVRESDLDGDLVARALGDPLRWRIVLLLAGERLCVGHLAEQLGAAQPLVSHHLKALRAAGLIQAERYRYWTYYRLRPAALDGLADQLWLLARTSPAATACRRLAGADHAPPSPPRTRDRPCRPPHPPEEAPSWPTVSSTRSRGRRLPPRSGSLPRSSGESSRWRPSNATSTSRSTACQVLVWSNSSRCSYTGSPATGCALLAKSKEPS